MIEEEQFDKYKTYIEPLLKEKGFDYAKLRFYDLSASFEEKEGQEVIESIRGKFITDEKKIYSFKFLFQKEGNTIELQEEETPKGIFSKLKNV